MLNSTYHLQHAIVHALKEQSINEFITLLDKWNQVILPDGRVFQVKIYETTEA
jgi:hypothetical protein